ncbi:MAG: hypothetical protein DYH13_07290 [Alphaproteobacteria bacterium PRO2]|nr:hypothetical protein [Alphaproteobacteria bacterium PRO2]
MMDPVTDANQKKIVRLYGAFGAGLVFSMVPLWSAAIVSAALILGVLIVAYVLRTDAEHGSLIENHMTFVIRTIWIGSLFALITTSAASVYFLKALDNAPLQPCAEMILSMASGMSDPTAMEKYINDFMSMPCWANYWQTNLMIFIIGGVIAAGPILIYFVVRYIRGLTRAMRGYRVANPKAWF